MNVLLSLIYAMLARSWTLQLPAVAASLAAIVKDDEDHAMFLDLGP